MGLLNFNVGDLIKPITGLIDKVIVDKDKKIELKHALDKLEFDLVNKQNEINIQEAKHASRFVAGWRPFIGWVGGFAMAYQYIIYPLLLWVFAAWFPELKTPPIVDASNLYPIILGMLGLGGMRSYDKLKNTDTKGIK